MRETVLHSVDEEFDERNTVLHLSLGILSGLRRWRRLVCNHSAEGSAPLRTVAAEHPADDREARPLEPPIEQDSFALAALGLLAVSERLISHLEPGRSPSLPLRRPHRIGSRRWPNPVPAGTLR